jgi:predicted TPR repeat methyltransferase
MSFSLLSSGDLLADRRYAYAVAAAKDGDHEAAADLLEQTLEIVPGWPPALLALGDARLALGAPEAAILAWQTALEGEPEDRLGARPRLARLGIGVAESAVSDAYIRALFDDYANRFDSHLRGALAYSGPETIMAALDRVAPEARFARVLDLGCGTGLMGEAIRARSDWLGGCDLSPAMVAKAEAKAIYDDLKAMSLLDYLSGQSAALALAADVLVYIGDLAPVFAAVAAALPPDGLFAFTVQKGADSITLGEDLRYAHSPDQLRLWAAGNGFEVVALDDCATRLDRGRPVPGLVGLLRKL